MKYISNTQQLRDYADYAKNVGLSLELYVRPDTYVTPSVKATGWNIIPLW